MLRFPIAAQSIDTNYFAMRSPALRDDLSLHFPIAAQSIDIDLSSQCEPCSPTI